MCEGVGRGVECSGSALWMLALTIAGHRRERQCMQGSRNVEQLVWLRCLDVLRTDQAFWQLC